ncbi:MAG: hypothetical protein ACI4SM_01210 [Candidatus Gastranaerophilaceae bacterium]
MKKKFQYRQNIAALFGCMAFLVLGLCSLLDNGGITYVSIASSVKTVLPGTLVLYTLGWLIGAMAEKSKISNDKSINSQLKKIIDEEVDGLNEDSNIELSEEDEDELNNLTIETNEE